MQIILLSGGSGTRLWPLSNDARSKQFLKILPSEDGSENESMVQRVVRQIREAGIEAEITVATGLSQKDAVVSQLGDSVNVVTEPSRHKTFPAICIAGEYLSKVLKCSPDETVIVMPCDAYTESGYFKALEEMGEAIDKCDFDLVVMGIKPTYPSSKYGYVVPDYHMKKCKAYKVTKFIEKPSVEVAEKLITEGALWNGGVFAFKLSYILKLSERYQKHTDFENYLDDYDKYPQISFDCEVAEHASSLGVVTFNGFWKDLGTWNTLTDELPDLTHGDVLTDGTGQNTHIFNELNIPLLCLGTRDLVIAASPDGIIVSEKSKSENVKQFAPKLKNRPMYEERRWGTYKVIDHIEFPDKFQALTKQLTLNPGCSISYQKHSCRDEVWTFIDGEGEIVLDGERKYVKRGDVIDIPKGRLHALRALTSLTFIEVQHGTNLIEEDIERFPFEW